VVLGSLSLLDSLLSSLLSSRRPFFTPAFARRMDRRHRPLPTSVPVVRKSPPPGVLASFAPSTSTSPCLPELFTKFYRIPLPFSFVFSSKLLCVGLPLKLGSGNGRRQTLFYRSCQKEIPSSSRFWCPAFTFPLLSRHVLFSVGFFSPVSLRHV